MERLDRHIPGAFKKTLAGSLVLHVILITIGLIVFRAEPKRMFFTPVYTVSLVEPSRARLPKKTVSGALSEPAKEEAAPEKKPEVKVREKTAEAPKKREEKAAAKVAEKPAETVSMGETIKKIRENLKKNEEKELVSSRIEEIRRRKREESVEVKKGLEGIRKRISEGADNGVRNYGLTTTPGSGITAKNIDIKHQAYFAVIRDGVQENWAYPEEFNGKDMSVIVSIKIARDGRLMKAWIEKSSGNRRFDSSLMNAVEKAAPFPPLPDGFEEEYLETGIRFCPNCAD